MRAVPYNRRFWRERWPHDHFNPHKNVVLRGVKLTPKAKPRDFELDTRSGSSDEVEVYRDGPMIYIVSVNRRHDYAGLTEYDLRDEPSTTRQSLGWDDYVALESCGEVFLQNDTDIREEFGPRGLDKKISTIASRLRSHLPG